ncbi:hypothetical protein F4083_06300 [Candidatus Poribacteria bacterium]|nr:hypothetical protein [Candidatus Poribacteria bacterium]MYB65834.1 hypothetical protein [Candidatus Poribacteria bacterium]MYF56116.1 hypothetical protein [Candidatus Poribacteria bacterium]MYI93920.1 hypothetical protein [Candidatus Poribacteria bacterium]
MKKEDTDIDIFRIDRSKLSVTSLFDTSDDKEYWLSKTPQERLAALELMRQINYGYDPTTARLERVFEIVEFPSD